MSSTVHLEMPQDTTVTCVWPWCWRRLRLPRHVPTTRNGSAEVCCRKKGTAAHVHIGESIVSDDKYKEERDGNIHEAKHAIKSDHMP